MTKKKLAIDPTCRRSYIFGKGKLGITLREKKVEAGWQIIIVKIAPNSMVAKSKTFDVGDIIEKIGSTHVAGMDLNFVLDVFEKT